MLAGWKRLSFIANDLFIDETRGFCKKHVDTKIIGEYICTPMEVYSQVLNGQNFKVLLLGKHSKNKDYKCFSAITYFPPGQISRSQFKEDTFKDTDGAEWKLQLRNQIIEIFCKRILPRR